MSRLERTLKREAVRKVLIAFFSIMIICSVVLSDGIRANAASNPFSKYLSSGKINCTWYAWQAAYDRMGVALPMLGNGGQWIDGAKKHGIPYGSVAKPNSIAVWTNSGAGHVAYVTRVEGSYMWVDEGGRGSTSDGTATNQKRLSAIGSYQFSKGDSSLVGFVYLEEQKDTTPPSITNVYIREKTDDYFKVTYTVSDNVGVNSEEIIIHCPHQNFRWTNNSSGNATWTFTFKWKDMPDGDYYVTITEWDAAGNKTSVDGPIVNKKTDFSAPTISNVVVSDVSSTGYTVSCTVTDNVGVTKVEFPTWTEANGQDDLVWHQGTINGNIASCRINISDHNGEQDVNYITHIYARDFSGNVSSVNNSAYPNLLIHISKPIVNAKYKVIHYKEKLDGNYAIAEEQTFEGKIGDNVTPQTKSYMGFTAPSAKSVTIKSDGSAAVSYYYTRNSYNLTWDFAGGKASGTYTKGTVKYEAPITVPVPTRAGYTFKGWNIEVPEKMPANDVTVKATWKYATNTPYTVEHYRQKVNGTYDSTPNEKESFTGKTNSSVTPEVKTYKGFTAPETQTVKIKANGTLVVKYYYTRNSYKLTWDFDGGNAKGSYTKGNVVYGSKITAPTPVKEGYEFTGWDKTVSAKMPAKNVSYKATWRKLTQDEQVEAFVQRFYVIILDRPAEPKGLNDWTTSLIDKKKTGADVAVGFINSPEFQSKKISDEEYLTKLYRAFFDREPDKAGFENWKAELKNGKSRDYVLGGFINSVEFNNLCKKYGIRTGSY